MKGYGPAQKYLAGRWRTVMAYDGKMRLVLFATVPVRLLDLDAFQTRAKKVRWMLEDAKISQGADFAVVTVCSASLVEVAKTNDLDIWNAYTAFAKRVLEAVFGTARGKWCYACGVKALGIAESDYDQCLTSQERRIVSIKDETLEPAV